jgi:Rrf2 family protein
VRITHKVDYGVRVMTALAGAKETWPVTREHLAEQSDIPPGFLDDILRTLRNGGLTRSHRGAEGGWSLAKPAEAITVADIIRVLEGPLASVRGVRPHELATIGIGEPYISLWVAVRAALRSVLEHVTVADLASGQLPPAVTDLLADPTAWTVP